MPPPDFPLSLSRRRPARQVLRHSGPSVSVRSRSRYHSAIPRHPLDLVRYPVTNPPPSSFRLTREAVLADAVRAFVQSWDPAANLVTPEEHRGSIRSLLEGHPAGEDVWLFAYGSLIWNPLIHWQEKQAALLRGYHRRFCLWTNIGRGTNECPGLTLALEPGGACQGIAYRIARAEAPQELELVWRREMLTGAYKPRWVAANTAEGPIRAIAFVINRDHQRYAGRLSEEQVAAILAAAKGPLGSCAAYLFNTASHLEELGVRDRRLWRLRAMVAARIGTSVEIASDLP
jgi:glutathione-specific gamma-glutamylcyclotransferase